MAIDERELEAVESLAVVPRLGIQSKERFVRVRAFQDSDRDGDQCPRSRDPEGTTGADLDDRLDEVLFPLDDPDPMAQPDSGDQGSGEAVHERAVAEKRASELSLLRIGDLRTDFMKHIGAGTVEPG